jgi:hypothetical protein
MAPAFTVQRVEGGFPHSEILGSKLVRSSPRHIAAYHVLHRLSAPRHPPDALTTLDYSHDRCSLGLTEHPSKKKDLSLDFSKDDFACQAHPALLAAGQGWFAGLGCLLAEYAASLRFQTSAHPTQEGRREPQTRSRAQSRSMDTGYGPKDQKDRGGACRDRTDDLKLAKLPLSQLS